MGVRPSPRPVNDGLIQEVDVRRRMAKVWFLVTSVFSHAEYGAGDLRLPRLDYPGHHK